MHNLICFEGIDYAGKTSTTKPIVNRIEAVYGPRVASGWEKAEEEIHKNPDHLTRFLFFIKELTARSGQVSRMLEQIDVVLERYLLSVFAYHNIIVGKQFEAETDVSVLRQPDCTVLLTVDEEALRQRMKDRPPRHPYESDPIFLLEVQREFLRLIDREKTVIVDTSNQPTEEIAKVVLAELVGRKLVRSRPPQME